MNEVSPEMLERVTALVARFAPGAPAAKGIAPDAELVRDLAFDSVRLVELLLECGEAFAVTLPVEQILEGAALSVRGVAAHVVRAGAGRA